MTNRPSVDHPPHYGAGTYETINVIFAAGWGREFCLGNALKYVTRAGKKGSETEDIEKAIWYLQHLVDRARTESEHAEPEPVPSPGPVKPCAHTNTASHDNRVLCLRCGADMGTDAPQRGPASPSPSAFTPAGPDLRVNGVATTGMAADAFLRATGHGVPAAAPPVIRGPGLPPEDFKRLLGTGTSTPSERMAPAAAKACTCTAATKHVRCGPATRGQWQCMVCGLAPRLGAGSESGAYDAVPADVEVGRG